MSDEPSTERKPRSQPAALLEIARNAMVFRDATGEPYATYDVGDGDARHRETWPLGSKQFAWWLGHRYLELLGKPVGQTALRTVVEALKSRAHYEGGEIPVHTRIAEHVTDDGDRRVYIDTGDRHWTAYRVTRQGWEIDRRPPVQFRRPRGQAALPDAAESREHEHDDGIDNDLDLLWNHVNAAETDRPLIAAWLVQALMPSGPYPVLVLQGGQGSGKSTAVRRLRQLIDPNHAPSRDAPRNPQDLAIAARNSWVIALDNLSGIPDWLSDALCRLATGGGFGTRELYENDQEVVFYDQRPIIVNGIDALAVRGDLRDRALVLELPRITGQRRATEADLDAAFDRDQPRILAALLDALSTALHRLPTTRLDHAPRMADFARVTEAAAPAIGLQPGDFARIYARSRHDAIDVEIEASTIGTALLRLLDAHDGTWQGRSEDLLAGLAQHATEGDRQNPDWPRTARKLGAHLKRLEDALAHRQVAYTRFSDGQNRGLRIWRDEPTTDTSDASDTSTPTSDSSLSPLPSTKNETREVGTEASEASEASARPAGAQT